MIETKNLKFAYKKSEDFNFNDILIKENETLLILGKSGVGKTTLLHLLAGLMRPTSGSVLIDHVDLTKLNQSQIDKFRGKNIGLVFQQNHFIASLSVIENILIAQSLIGARPDKQAALNLLKRLGLEHKANEKTSSLSHGEKQRVAIARALINKPKLLLADEPTSALDDGNCVEVIKLLQDQARQEGTALIIVTHDSRLKDFIHNHIILS